MIDAKKLKRKVMLGALSSPATVAPFVVGVTAAMCGWAAGARADLGLLAGVAGALGAAGVFITKLLFSTATYVKKAEEELEEEERTARERVLDELERRLVADSDPRTEAALRDMRSLAKAFEELRNSGAFRLNMESLNAILAGVHELFEQCVRSLEQTLHLWHTARGLTTKAARLPILKQREDILGDVAKSIRQMGQTLVDIQNLSEGSGADSELGRIGEELDRHLKVARQVEERIRAFESQIDAAARE